MKTIRFLAIPAMVLCLAFSASDASAQKKKKKLDTNTSDVTGTIVSFEKSPGGDTSTLTVKVQGAKKKSPATERKIEVGKSVKLESMIVSKKQFGIKSATAEDLKVGERIYIQTKEGKNDQAERVFVMAAGKKKKAAQ